MTYPLYATAQPAARPATGEAALIAAAQAGDSEAFNQLALAYQDRMFSAAYYILGDRDAAADATQEALIAAYRGLRGFRQGATLKNWLLRIVTRKCYDTFRDARRRRSDSLDAFGEYETALVSREAGPEATAQRRELARHLEASLARLAFAERQVVVLYDVQGMSYLEIAEATGYPMGTVKSKLSRARARLRADLAALDAPGAPHPTPGRRSSAH